MPTPENKVKEAIKKELDKLGCYYFMPVQTGMGKRTLDFLVCYKGCFFGLEAKAPGKKVTALQENCMREIRKAGGECTTVDSVEVAKNVSGWIKAHAYSMLGDLAE